MYLFELHVETWKIKKRERKRRRGKKVEELGLRSEKGKEKGKKESRRNRTEKGKEKERKERRRILKKEKK